MSESGQYNYSYIEELTSTAGLVGEWLSCVLSIVLLLAGVVLLLGIFSSRVPLLEGESTFA